MAHRPVYSFGSVFLYGAKEIVAKARLFNQTKTP